MLESSEPMRNLNPKADVAGTVGRLVAGPAPNWEGDHEDGAVARGTLLTIGGSTIALLIGGWALAYATGIFPTLGSYSFRYAPPVRSEDGIGTANMFLIAGQTAYIDYDLHGAQGDRGAVYIDVRRWPAVKPSAHMIRVNGVAAGRLSVKIEQSGFYRFHHQIGPTAYREPIAYQMSWGASWADSPDAQHSD